MFSPVPKHSTLDLPPPSNAYRVESNNCGHCLKLSVIFYQLMLLFACFWVFLSSLHRCHLLSSSLPLSPHNAFFFCCFVPNKPPPPGPCQDKQSGLANRIFFIPSRCAFTSCLFTTITCCPLKCLIIFRHCNVEIMSSTLIPDRWLRSLMEAEGASLKILNNTIDQ